LVKATIQGPSRPPFEIRRGNSLPLGSEDRSAARAQKCPARRIQRSHERSHRPADGLGWSCAAPFLRPVKPI